MKEESKIRKERDLDELLKRNVAFLRSEEVDRPLYGVSRVGHESHLKRYSRIGARLPSTGPVRPEMLRTRDFLKDVDRLLLEHEALGGDLLWAATPFVGVPWVEAIIGCPVRVSFGSLWADSQEKDWVKLEKVDLSENNAWLQKLLELQEALVDHLAVKHPVGISTMMRGPGDMAAAALGTQRFVLSLYDHLAKVKGLLSYYTDVWLKVAECQRRLTLPFQGGYTVGSWVGLWGTDPCQYLQDDVLAILSPSLCQRALVEQYRHICSRTRYSIFHLHPSALYAVDELLKVKNLTIIEINRERVDIPIERLLPTLKRIQQDKALFINWCPGTPSSLPIEKEVRCLLKELSPRGLCLGFSSRNVEEGKAFLKMVDMALRTRRT